MCFVFCLYVLLLQEKPEPGRANIYKSVIINSSKEMMSFSDFPPPADLPNNMHHSEVLLYLRLYAQTFNLLPRIRFQVGDLHKKEKTVFVFVSDYCNQREADDKF